MVISGQYGQLATPSEANSNYVGVANTLATPMQVASGIPTEAIPILINMFVSVTGTLPDNSPAGTFGSLATLQNNLPL